MHRSAAESDQVSKGFPVTTLEEQHMLPSWGNFCGPFYCEYNAVRRTVYLFLERPSGGLCFAYNISLLFIILFSIIYNALVSIPNLGSWMVSYLSIIDCVLFVVFLLEYVCRIWAVGCRSKYSGLWGRLRFACKPLCLLDSLAIIGLGVCMSHRFAYYTNPPSFIIIRCMRFLQFARLFHFDRYVTSWRILWSVFQDHLQELITTVYFAFVFLVIVSYMLWLAERRSDVQFTSLADAFYCTLITMTTVGYGDKVPKTFIGRAIISTVGVLGVFLWALPAGIIGSGFALKVREERKKRKHVRLQPTAAYLIQSWWRLKSIERDICCRHEIYKESAICTDPSRMMKPEYAWNKWVASRQANGDPSPRRFFLALRYVRLLKYFVAKRRFAVMREPNAVINTLNENSRCHWKLVYSCAELNRKVNVLLKKTENGDTQHMLSRRLDAIDKRMCGIEANIMELLDRVRQLQENLASK